jgi:hypothetical protein
VNDRRQFKNETYVKRLKIPDHKERFSVNDFEMISNVNIYDWSVVFSSIRSHLCKYLLYSINQNFESDMNFKDVVLLFQGYDKLR